MQRILTIAAIGFALGFGSGCSSTGGCTSCGSCGSGGCATGGSRTSGFFGFLECKHVGGKCDCGKDNVQGTCDYYSATGTGTNGGCAAPLVVAATAPAPGVTPSSSKMPAGTFEDVPAPKAKPKVDGK